MSELLSAVELLHDITKSVIEILQVDMQLLKWWVMLHLEVWQHVQVWEMAANTNFSPSTG